LDTGRRGERESSGACTCVYLATALNRSRR
jgi:hypothetical protein